MTTILLLIFILTPIIQVACIIAVGNIIGITATISLIILTAILGVKLLKQESIKSFFSIKNRLNNREIPEKEIIEIFLIAVSGVFLITPGFITDILGLACLIEQSRKVIAEHIFENLKDRIKTKFIHEEGEVIQGVFEDTTKD